MSNSQAGILQPIPRLARYLTFSQLPEAEPRAVGRVGIELCRCASESHPAGNASGPGREPVCPVRGGSSRRDIGAGRLGMRALERLLVKYTLFLCNLFDVTPQYLEKLRRKKQRPLRPEQRHDYFEA